jgi:hypothetical protein
MFHWCADESLAVMAALPFIGHYCRRLHAWYHSIFKTSCHTEKCCQAPTSPSENSWDEISLSNVEEKIGLYAVDDLIGNLELLKIVDTPQDHEFSFFLNQEGQIKATFRGRIFLLIDSVSWKEI